MLYFLCLVLFKWDITTSFPGKSGEVLSMVSNQEIGWTFTCLKTMMAPSQL
nr:hypothetical protein Iba_chr07bCG14240 [Ipomoea batatas]GMD19701.1 hypothetical protein Iba_chr07eCG10790 [Ipomoea batatas]GMD21274.1 hypothetical protein Iba_chr07fCG12550 [Ipomoea batatas]